MIAPTSLQTIRRMLDDDDALDASIRAALAETVRRHRHGDVPLAVWRDGRVQDVPAEDVGGDVGEVTPKRA
jgi:hypothetical protein